MTNINVHLRESLGSVSSNMAVAPQIDDKKLNNAVKSFGFTGNPSAIVALYDNTLFGSGKDGILFTGERLIYREGTFSDPVSILFSNIDRVDYVEKSNGSKGGVETSLLIRRKDGGDFSITGLAKCDYRMLAEILQACVTNFTEFKEERQLIPIDEMPEPLKVAYVQIIINSVHSNGRTANDKEFAEVLQLMTRLDLSPDARFSLRSYMASEVNHMSLVTLLDCVSDNSPPGQVKPLHVSLVKDLINIYYNSGGRDIDKFSFLQDNKGLFQVSKEEIELAVMAIKNDYDMLREDMTDDQIVSALKLLSAKAAAVGTPLAAVYLSGSVVGMSAAGLTSGLASLGMGGLLGMSGMVTGIGVAVLIGVGAYAGVRKLTGADELSRFKRRELMLNEVIKQTQLTISLVMKDINFITEKLNEAIQSHGAQDVKIKQLVELMKRITSAGQVLTKKSSMAQASASKLRCAHYLDESKLRSLTREPTKAELYNFIMDFYEDRRVLVSGAGDGNEVHENKLCIKQDCSTRQLEDLARAFDAIGYFKMGDVLLGSASDVATKARDKLSSLFS